MKNRAEAMRGEERDGKSGRCRRTYTALSLSSSPRSLFHSLSSCLLLPVLSFTLSSLPSLSHTYAVLSFTLILPSSLSIRPFLLSVMFSLPSSLFLSFSSPSLSLSFTHSPFSHSLRSFLASPPWKMKTSQTSSAKERG